VRFLADMGVDIRVVDWLRTQGHDAVHLRELGMHRASDEAILAKAIAEDRIVVTFDLDFGALAALARERAPGIVLFRLGNARLAAVIARLGSVLTEAADALARPAVILVEDTRLRIRDLPIGRLES
jgi:predicted nuclease of predicted toxin-antitoxin system